MFSGLEQHELRKLSGKIWTPFFSNYMSRTSCMLKELWVWRSWEEGWRHGWHGGWGRRSGVKGKILLQPSLYSSLGHGTAPPAVCLIWPVCVCVAGLQPWVFSDMCFLGMKSIFPDFVLPSFLLWVHVAKQNHVQTSRLRTQLTLSFFTAPVE